MGVDELIAHAGRRGRMVRLKLKSVTGNNGVTESLELEPYTLKRKEGRVSLFCLEPKTCMYLDIELGSVLEAEVTDRSFKPRFPVAF